MFKKSFSIILPLGIFLSSTSLTLAHVAVTPSEVGVALRQDFSVGVPNEKDIPTTQVRLVIPEGLESVTPYVKPGWKIEMKTTDDGEEAKISEIIWSGGEIGKGLRESFVFRAQTPAETTTLMWKAYQTYSDGTVVSWSTDPDDLENLSEEEMEEHEKKGVGPYSETKIVKDLAETETKSEKSDQTTLWVAYSALALGLVGIVLNFRKRP